MCILPEELSLKQQQLPEHIPDGSVQAEQQEESFLDYPCKYVCIIMLSFEAQMDYDQRWCWAISAFIQVSISSLTIEMSICPQLNRVLLNHTKADQT